MQKLTGRSKLMIGGGVVVAAVAVFAILSALTNDEGAPAKVTANTTTTVALSAIVAPADVATTPPVGAADPEVARRLLDAPGAFTCADPGVWHPFAENPGALLVGESSEGDCLGGVLTLPLGYCSTQPCSEVPPTWQVQTQLGVSAQNLFLVTVPVADEPNLIFYCVLDGVVGPGLKREPTVSIQEACPRVAPLPPDAPTDVTSDIPFVPQVSSDIPSAPPPVSSDIPSP
jgi:hypothetical protein